MKVAFITELTFGGKVPSNYLNMRTEFAWMHALDADHFNVTMFEQVKDYDHVFIIFPKGEVYLNAVGSKLIDKQNPISVLLSIDIVSKLKSYNKKIYFVQEGPHWLWNDYELSDQINFYNTLANCDAIFSHNESDLAYYKGLVPSTEVYVLPTLMVEDTIKDIKSKPEDKVIVGGNFARWYGGFESYILAQEFEVPIWGQTSHAMRLGEDQFVNLLPRVMWVDWMRQLSSFKYAIHLMPTVAAGTFSLNCAYFGIPCIGNIEVDTQRLCHPELSVNVDDLETARHLANRLKKDLSFYKHCSEIAQTNYKKYYGLDVWKENINKVLS